METIHIALVTDENFAQHAGVMITSLLHNKQSANPITIHVLGDKLSKTSLDRLEEIVKNYNASINFYVINEEIFKELPPYPPMSNSRTSYFKLVIPHVLSDVINKVLYLDVDMIVRKDITELWNTNIDNYYLAAVKEDYCQKLLGSFSGIRLILGIPENEPFFNAGLMLINLSKWRKNDILNKAIAAKKNICNKMTTSDQGPLNAILWGKWLQLNHKWNMMTLALIGSRRLALGNIDNVKDPAIVHFAGPNIERPWKYGCMNPYAKDYWNYLQMTPWKNWSVPFPGVKELRAMFSDYFYMFLLRIGQFSNYVKLKRYLKRYLKIFFANNTKKEENK